MNLLNDPIFDFCRVPPGRFQSEKIRKYISWHLPTNPTLQLNVGFVGNVGFLLGFFSEKNQSKWPGVPTDITDIWIKACLMSVMSGATWGLLEGKF